MKKYGLVFSGGGGRGAYQIGAWRAIRELGIEKYIAGVSGASVGSLNAALFLNGDLGKAEDVWFNITPSRVLSHGDNYKSVFREDNRLDFDAVISNINNAIETLDNTLNDYLDDGKHTSMGGAFTTAGITDIIEKTLDFEKVSSCGKSFYVSVVNMSVNLLEYIQLSGASQKKITSFLLASAAMPVVYESQKIGVCEYCDGGLKDNIPVKPLYDEGIRDFIVIHLKTLSPSVAGNFPDAEFVEIKPDDEYTGIIDGTLDFSSEGAQRRFAAGYLDTYAALTPLADMLDAENESTL